MQKIKIILKELINYILNFLGLIVISKKFYTTSVANSNIACQLNAIKFINKEENIKNFLKYLDKSTSQKKRVAMDLFVLQFLDFKKNGFFIEYGAGNGILNSNTYLMEKEFGWKGILSEPANIYYPQLENNRKCFIDKNCVWSSSDKELTLIEAPKEIDSGMSSISEFAFDDRFSKIRSRGTKYKVNSITLEKLLDKYNAPKVIDYISIDTEGSEYETLKNFNFDKYSFRFITCEHMYVQNKRDKILKLLNSQGYDRICENISGQDDWFVMKSN